MKFVKRDGSRQVNYGHFHTFMEKATKIPMMTREEELRVSRLYIKTHHRKYRDALMLANLRFVVKCANQYLGAGPDLMDLIQEGNVGLLRAIEKFNPDRGYRLCSYAVHWIQALIRNHVMVSHSVVRIGTTQNQRTLYWKLRSMRHHNNADAGFISNEELAAELGVPYDEMVDIECRVAFRDYSLNAHPSSQVNKKGESRETFQDLTPDLNPLPDEVVERELTQTNLRETIMNMMETLNDKQKKILLERLIAEDPKTLHQLGNQMGVCRERARQIEKQIIARLKDELAEV